MRPKVAGEYLLEKMRLARIDLTYIILRKEKWDIPAYFSDGKNLDIPLAYIMTEDSPGVPFTVDQAYPFIRHANIAFGFPDILFYPDDAFVQLFARQARSKADLVLGLFPAENMHSVDMIRLDAQNNISELLIKPAETDLKYTWLIAVWTPLFTQFIHDFLVSCKTAGTPESNQNEIFLGDVVNAALAVGLYIDRVTFEYGQYMDIGTPDSLVRTFKTIN